MFGKIHECEIVKGEAVKIPLDVNVENSESF